MNYISKNNFVQLLEILKKDYQVYLPVKKGEQRFYDRYTTFTDNIVIGEVRPFEPLKSFFTPAREIVAEDFKPDIPHSEDKPFAIVGVKACDLKGFKIHDYVFKDHDYQDPFYTKLREENLIISADCTCAIDTCFCLSMDVKPYPQENFDINLSQLREGYIVDVGSPKGQTLVEKNSSLFEDVKEEFVSEREEQRAKVAREVEENIKKNDIPHQDALNGA
ncbi:MAG: hypothetical protein KAV99_02685, partial [Candidatus Latescibacteria bacterium]|nr:hypothetical protein [Candidatus Latescibacterota bacterium]